MFYPNRIIYGDNSLQTLSVSKNTLILNSEEIKNITISNVIGTLSVTNSNNLAVTYSLSNNILTITGVNNSDTVLTISDSVSSVNVNVTVSGPQGDCLILN